MQSRMERYENFLTNEYRKGFLKPEEYSLADMTDDLRLKIKSGQFKRVVFTGMGCSAIVSDVVAAFFQSAGSELEFHVLNDYDHRYLLPSSVMDDEGTLIVLSSYSGHSNEPVHVFHQLRHAHDRMLLLTSGGRLGALGEEAGVSIARWTLSEPDREYPLFHVGQYFAILLDMFLELGLIEQDHRQEVRRLPGHLEADFTEAHRELARTVAERSRDANVIMLASPKWHESLLKLGKMHLNEIAMVPAARNYFHEFCHSEVATLSDPTRKHSLIVFRDEDDDDYTKAKMENLVGLLTSDRPENRNIEVSVVPLAEPTFTRKYFTALEFIQYLTLDLGRAHETRSRELISEAAGNPWYHGDTIRAEEVAG
ncbi:SIS domain-containing protein [Streptomyces sp. NPDC005900]|uniref:SIS domain-containing protein n=2 Tax=Streptomyces TaxID=1883 RepID=UPI0033D88DCC